jgi:hypothetical protein
VAGVRRRAARVGVVVLAKYPRPGRVKTRLAAAIGGAGASAIYRAFVADLAARLQGLGLEVWWAYAPSGAPFATLVRSRRCFPQRGGDLGRRMAHAIGVLHRRGVRGVIVLGADAPHVSLAQVRRAATALRTGADVVLGPAADGGYYLIGMRSVVPALFRDMPWSSARVLRETRARIRRLGLRLVQVRPDFDVDDAASLARLQRLVVRRPRLLPQTRRALGLVYGATISRRAGSPPPAVSPSWGCDRR